MADFAFHPEDKARSLIDRRLAACGWLVQSKADMNLGAGLGVAVREFQTASGRVDYELFVGRKLCGVIEAKAEGTTLSGFSEQAARYMDDVPKNLVREEGQVRFDYVASGTETLFRDHADPDSVSRRVFALDAAYFKPLAKDQHIASARRERPGPSVEDVEKVLRVMPAASDTELRDRALIAFTLLAGARDRAIASFSLEHVDLEEGAVFQDTRKVRTKRAKTFWTKFFPVGDLADCFFREWVSHLVKNKAWGLSDPLFPATAIVQDAEQHFRADGLSRTHWETPPSIRRYSAMPFRVRACRITIRIVFGPRSRVSGRGSAIPLKR